MSCFSPTCVPLRYPVKGGWSGWWLDAATSFVYWKAGAILCPCCFTTKLMFAVWLHKLISAFIWCFLTGHSLSVRLCLLGGGIILKNKTQSVRSRTYYENRPLNRELQCSDCDKYCERRGSLLWESVKWVSDLESRKIFWRRWWCSWPLMQAGHQLACLGVEIHF